MQTQRKPRPINARFVVRGLIVALVVIIVALVAVSRLPPQVLAPLAYYYQINQPDMTITIRLKRPTEQFSTYDRPKDQQPPPQAAPPNNQPHP